MKNLFVRITLLLSLILLFGQSDAPWSGFSEEINESWRWNEGLGFTYHIDSNWYWSSEFGYLRPEVSDGNWIYVYDEANWIWYLEDHSSFYYSFESDSWQEFAHDTEEYLSFFSRFEESVDIESNKLTLDPYLWIDFMPKPNELIKLDLMAGIKIEADNVLANDIKVEKVWIYHPQSGFDLWEVDCRTPNPPVVDELNVTANSIVQVIRFGPLWDVGTEVSVAVLISIDGSEYKILYKNGIGIIATY